MFAVADTSPLNYLVCTGLEAVLPKLYEVVVIPPQVRAELLSDDAPATVREWAGNPPEWIRIRLLKEHERAPGQG